MGTQQTNADIPSGSASELELRGRIHLFMSGLFKISDPSATNSRGDYADMLLDYDSVGDTIDRLKEDVNLEAEQDNNTQAPENAGESRKEKGKYNGSVITPLWRA